MMAMKMKEKNKSMALLAQAVDLSEAVALVKKHTYTKFDASLDLAIRLGVDPQKADQMIRGSVLLPYGSGKKYRVLALCTADKQQEALEAGADYVGLDDFIKKIEQGWREVDAIVTMPTIMAKLGRLGKILGPRGLMPNPKIGTVTMDVANMIRQIKGGRIAFKVDRYGIIHASIGRVSFSLDQIVDNAVALLRAVVKLKPVSLKGVYVQSISLSSTMSKGVFVDKNLVMKL